VSKRDKERDPNAILKFNLKILESLKQRLQSCKSEDINVLLRRDIKELEEKIERIKKL
jgi:hypothetical protein